MVSIGCASVFLVWWDRDGMRSSWGGYSLPWISATVCWNWLCSSSSRLRFRAMKSSKRSVKLAMRSRRSSKLHVMLGRLDVIEEGVWADTRGGRIALLIESEDSNIVAIVSGSKTTDMEG